MRLDDDGRNTHRARRQHGNGSFVDRGVGIVVPIDACSGQGDKESARGDLARIEFDEAGHLGVWFVDAIKAAARDLSDLSEA